MSKRMVRLPYEAQAYQVKRLRKLADDIEAGCAAVLDSHTCVNVLDTTQPGDTALHCDIDHSSYLLVLRYERADRKPATRRTNAQSEVSDLV